MNDRQTLTSPARRAPVIVAERLSKWFGTHRGIEDLSLEVLHGEVFGLLGPNGAGKSTALRLFLGHLRPTGGSVTVNGHDAWTERRSVHSVAGVLPSDFSYYDSMTGDELLRLFSKLRGFTQSNYTAELAERLKADLSRPIKELSRGNKQKIGLIQALFHRPPLLILDEPTSGLDPLMQEEFLRLIAEVRDGGCTVVLSSHNMAEVERSCDRVALVRAGRLLATNDVTSLMQAGRKRITITFESSEAARAFAAANAGCAVAGSEVSLDLSGSIDAVLRRALEHKVIDVSTVRPTLERAFVHMYASGGPGE